MNFKSTLFMLTNFSCLVCWLFTKLTFSKKNFFKKLSEHQTVKIQPVTKVIICREQKSPLARKDLRCNVKYLISVYYRNLMCFNRWQLYISSKFNVSPCGWSLTNHWPRSSFPLKHGSRGLHCHLSPVKDIACKLSWGRFQLWKI